MRVRNAMAAFAALLFLSGVGLANPIDHFNEAVSVLDTTVGGGGHISTVLDPTVLGGELVVFAGLGLDPGSIGITVGGGTLTYSSTVGGTSAFANANWSGPGLIGTNHFDLTAGGADAFSLVVLSNTASVNVVLRVQTDGGHSSDYLLAVPVLTVATTYNLAFSDFVKTSSGGELADYTDVVVTHLIFYGGATTLTIDSLDTNGSTAVPEPASLTLCFLGLGGLGAALKRRHWRAR